MRWFFLAPQTDVLIDWQDLSYECLTKIWFSYFSTKTYVVGTKKNRLNETVLLSTQKYVKIDG